MSIARPEPGARGELFLRAVLGFLAFGLPPMLAAAFLVTGIDPDRDLHRYVERALQAQLVGIVVLLALASWMRPLLGVRISSRVVWRTAAAYLCFLVPWMLLVFGYSWFLQSIGHPLTPQPHLAYFTQVHPHGFSFGLAIVTVTLLGPIAEEILFRGYFSEALCSTLGPWPGEIASALLFGLLHEPKNALPIAALGLFFATLRRNTGSLAPAMLAHVLHNSVTVALAMGAPKLLPTLQR